MSVVLGGMSLIFANASTTWAKSCDIDNQHDIQEIFEEASQWFADIQLQLNIDKTQHMLCSLSHGVDLMKKV